MKRNRLLGKLGGALLLVLLWAGGAGRLEAAGPLTWDAAEKAQPGQVGEWVARFAFTAKNVTTNTVVVDEVKPGCGCTVARLPAHPWRLAPGESGRLELAVDLRGVSGVLARGVEVRVGDLIENLGLKVVFPPGVTNGRASALEERLWNQELAKGDHQAVFKDNCVRCHLVPAFGKTGERLYRVACAQCHESPQRAAMVPDLRAPHAPRDEAYWRQWITEGKEGTLMPGFAAINGGPLTAAQTDSLVAYLLTAFPAPGATNAPAAKAPR